MLQFLRQTQLPLLKCHRYASAISSNHQEFCRNLVRKVDFFNYLCCLPLPQPQQRFAFALRALNAEISLITDRARTQQTASLRYQYWEQAVRNLFSGNNDGQGVMGTGPSPIESELGTTLNYLVANGCSLSQHWLLRLLQARRDRSGDVPFADYEELEDYAEATNAPIHFALSEAMGVKSIEVDHALAHLAKAQGLITHLRSVVPLARQQRVLVLPTQLLVEHHLPAELALRLCLDPSKTSDISTTKISVEEAVKRFLDICQVIATRARDHTAKALALKPSPPTRKSSKPVELLLLPAVPICRLLWTLATPRVGFDIRHPHWLVPREGMMPLRIAWHAARGSRPSVPT